MIAVEPMPFAEAIKALAEKDLLPDFMTSADIRALAAALKNQSFFSAQTTDEYLLQLYQDKIGGMLNPVRVAGQATTEYSPAYVARAIKDFLISVNYAPATEDAGTIKDLSSDARVSLVLQTNKQLAQGQGNWLQSQRAGVLDSFPADELFRLEDRVKKRDWLARWRLAGEQTDDPIGTGWTITPDERLIALKNHDIWNWIGSSDLFDDALDVIWPPFAFNSGMWVKDVSRADCEEVGLLDKGEAAPEPANIVSAIESFSNKISKFAEEVAA